MTFNLTGNKGGYVIFFPLNISYLILKTLRIILHLFNNVKQGIVNWHPD